MNEGPPGKGPLNASAAKLHGRGGRNLVLTTIFTGDKARPT